MLCARGAVVVRVVTHERWFTRNFGPREILGRIFLHHYIEMGADVVDIDKPTHPPPTLGESIGTAAEVAYGSCTALPLTRK